MDTEASTIEDKLLYSITALISAMDSFKTLDMSEFHMLSDGLYALQNTLWASKGVSNTLSAPFSMLCLMLCDALRQQLLECRRNALDPSNILVMEHNLAQVSKRLLELFHAFSTFLNMRYW
jgi:hypothetical protein